MASRADEYRRRAQQCLEMAAAFRDREARISLSYMAQVWLRLADNYRDANRDANKLIGVQLRKSGPQSSSNNRAQPKN